MKAALRNVDSLIVVKSRRIPIQRNLGHQPVKTLDISNFSLGDIHQASSSWIQPGELDRTRTLVSTSITYDLTIHVLKQELTLSLISKCRRLDLAAWDREENVISGPTKDLETHTVGSSIVFHLVSRL